MMYVREVPILANDLAALERQAEREGIELADLLGSIVGVAAIRILRAEALDRYDEPT